MTFVVGLAALVLWVRDKWTVPKDASEGEREAIRGKHSARLVRGWVIAQGLMAAVSIPLNLLGLITKSIPMRVIYIGLGSLYLLACWDMLRNKREEFDDAEDD